jgi:ankyrin repeat protein
MKALNEQLLGAVWNGNTLVVKSVLYDGADPDIRNIDGKPVLLIASERGFGEIVQALLDKGANVNITDTNGRTALMSAADNGRADIVYKLLEKGADVNVKAGLTALMIASKEGRAKIVRALLDKGADLNMKSFEGTALMLAIRMNHADVVKVLIENGADVNQGSYSTTPLKLAEDKPEITQMLIQAGAAENMLISSAIEEKNLLKNPSADQGLQYWEAYGQATTEYMSHGNPYFVVRHEGYLMQDVPLPNTVGKYVLIIGRVSSEWINTNSAITGLPYISGYFLEEEPQRAITGYLEGQNLLCSAKKENEWVYAWGIFEVPRKSGRLRFILHQKKSPGVTKYGSAARFDDLGLYLFKSKEKAQSYRDVLMTSGETS